MPEVMFNVVTKMRRWPVHLLLGLVRLYQRLISPALPAVFGPTYGCRFHPTCSHYAIQALQQRRFFPAVGLILWRLVRCTPLHPGGEDPVPRARDEMTVTTRRARPARFQCSRVRS